jgi:hypothetical protein
MSQSKVDVVRNVRGFGERDWHSEDEESVEASPQKASAQSFNASERKERR